MIGETKARIDVIVIYLCPERWSLPSFDLRINLRDRFSEEWRTLSKSWKLRNKKNRPQNQAILTIHRDSITELSRASRGEKLGIHPTDDSDRRGKLSDYSKLSPLLLPPRTINFQRLFFRISRISNRSKNSDTSFRRLNANQRLETAFEINND